MIVCHCMGISDRDIRAAIDRGARSCQQVGRACKAGRACGGCQPAIRQLLENEARGEHTRTLLSVLGVVPTS